MRLPQLLVPALIVLVAPLLGGLGATADGNATVRIFGVDASGPAQAADVTDNTGTFA